MTKTFPLVNADRLLADGPISSGSVRLSDGSCMKKTSKTINGRNCKRSGLHTFACIKMRILHVWIWTQRSTVTSRCASKLATLLSTLYQPSISLRISQTIKYPFTAGRSHKVFLLASVNLGPLTVPLMQEVHGAPEHPVCAFPRLRLPVGPAGERNQRKDDGKTWKYPGKSQNIRNLAT
jgi:hypothetical protein